MLEETCILLEAKQKMSSKEVKTHKEDAPENALRKQEVTPKRGSNATLESR